MSPERGRGHCAPTPDPCNTAARVGISAEVQLSPGPARLRAVLLDQPLARPVELQARAVHQQGHGLGAGPWSWDLQRLGSAAQGGVVGNRESEPEQTKRDPIRPSVWRRAKRNTALRVSAVLIARSE